MLDGATLRGQALPHRRTCFRLPPLEAAAAEVKGMHTTIVFAILRPFPRVFRSGMLAGDDNLEKQRLIEQPGAIQLSRVSSNLVDRARQ